MLFSRSPPPGFVEPCLPTLGRAVPSGPEWASDFDRLRTAVGRMGSRDAFLYAFDLFEINGDDLRRCEWQVRRATLASYSARPSRVFGYPITSTAPTARLCSRPCTHKSA